MLIRSVVTQRRCSWFFLLSLALPQGCSDDSATKSDAGVDQTVQPQADQRIDGAQDSTPGPEGDEDYTHDADEFIWGTEGVVHLEDSQSVPEDTAQATAVINDVLHTTLVKIRVGRPSHFDPDNPSTIIDLPQFNVHYDLDPTADYFQEQGWSMLPMLSPTPLINEGDTVTEPYIEEYVDFVEWFVDRYKEKANIQYIELVNAPFDSWKGTPEQLLETCNRVYDRIKPKHPELMIGTPGFEYFGDDPNALQQQVPQVEHFLENDAKFDFWAFHGYKTLHTTPPQGGQGPQRQVYPPNKTGDFNALAGVAGAAEIRSRLDARGWTDRPIFDTELTCILAMEEFNAENDAQCAAFTVQDLVLKRTLTVQGKPALAGALPHKILPRCDRSLAGECTWASLNFDGSPSQMVQATGLLWSKLNAYSHVEHLSGGMDDFEQVWVEKFANAGGELYIFFKPFGFDEEQGLVFDDSTAPYTFRWQQAPAALTLTGLDGSTEAITPATEVTLEAEMRPAFLEVQLAP